jgi:3-oxoacyl-[acyl-carrier-protein] synthase-3
MALRLGTNEVNALEGDCAVIVLGADRAQHPAERFFFGSVMGDAAIALAMGRRSSRLRVLNISQHSEILATEGELSDQDAIQRFRERNPLLIRHIILRCIEEVGYTLDDVAAIVPHTPYTMIWDVMASLLDYPREAILTEDIGVTGHMNSNDSMVHLLRAIERGRLLTGDLVVLINPGFGGTRGCTLIRV